MNFWQKKLNSLQQRINKDDLSNFTRWPEIIGTMIASVHLSEFDYLKNSNVLIETKLKPNSFKQFPQSSTNNVHHAYSLQLLKDYTNLNFDQYGTIVEFGGGYGNMCRLIKNMNHRGNYYIYDFKELNVIQQHYLGKNEITENVYYLNDGNLINPVITKDNLFIALWSLTESPSEQRDKLMSDLNIFNCDYILIGFVNSFDGNENIEWLSNDVSPKSKDMGYDIKINEIEHMKNNFYLMAKRK